MLVAAIVGLDNRATMDLDTTLKNLPLTPEAIRNALEAGGRRFDDGVTFEVGKISPIREDDIYGGYRVMLNAQFDTLITLLSIDVSTGDAITPHAVQYQFSEILMMRNPTSCGRTTSKPLWRRRWKPSAARRVQHPTERFLRCLHSGSQHRNLIRRYFPKP